jgi:hypothetical protein
MSNQKWGFLPNPYGQKTQIPPDLVVKSQGVDIATVILSQIE